VVLVLGEEYPKDPKHYPNANPQENVPSLSILDISSPAKCQNATATTIRNTANPSPAIIVAIVLRSLFLDSTFIFGSLLMGIMFPPEDM